MILRVAALPEGALAASAAFHGRELPRIVSALSETRDPITVVFAPADHTHGAWRMAAVQSLARSCAPRRVNAVASDDEDAVAAAVRYLADADGVTGQYLPLDGTGAGTVLFDER